MTRRVDVRCTPTGFATMLTALGAFWTGEPAPAVPGHRAGQLVEPIEVEAARRFLPFPTGHSHEPRSCYARAQ